MADVVDSKTRSRMMAGIGPKDTRPELALRKRLHASGFRYRLHSRKLPGTPDIVLPRRRAVIFVHGCFWHRHQRCRYSTMPATRPEFWAAKFEANVARDTRAKLELLEGGWRVATVWECGLRPAWADASIADLERWLSGDEAEFETAVVREGN